jgi:cell wall-associated NlpC family hydrolase
MISVTRGQRTQVRDFTRAQIGDGYRWLGAGPDVWDCSGLTLKAWESFGVKLPHQSGEQINAINGNGSNPYTGEKYVQLGKVVPFSAAALSALRLGDLVFVYGDVAHPESVGHVAVFTGWSEINGINRRMITAAVNPQLGVLETTIDWGGTPSGLGYIGHLA